MRSIFTKAVLFILLASPLLTTAQGMPGTQLRIVPIGTDTLELDSAVVLPGSIKVCRAPCDSASRVSGYRYETKSGLLIFAQPTKVELEVRYERLAFLRTTSYARKDSTLIRAEAGNTFTPYVIGQDLFPDARFEQGELVKAGSISRGVSFGNSQDLAVNSNLNLQLSGKITERFQVLASVTDDNIPIQPDGNTQQLQDFDQVYIRIFDEETELTAGDFEIRSTKRHFMKYQKRARGATFITQWGDSLEHYSVSGSAAVSKGKFARNIINGVEGNQGPYRLTGDENERFIIIMAGTERVFIDGRLLQRGQDYDYVIDYNTAEVIFTPKNLITKDRRIVIEFQYSDRNYARALLQGGATGTQGKVDWYVHALSEQDSKNQPLQQELSGEDRFIMQQAGDALDLAVIAAVDSVGFNDSQVLYALVDSLGYDSVLVRSNDAQRAVYRAVFSRVGSGEGDYLEDGFTANGRAYRWVAPDTVNGSIVRRGDHRPVRVLVTPKLRRMVVAGGRYRFSENHQLSVETALSRRDQNTFSELDSEDDQGRAIRSDYLLKKAVGQTQTWKIGTRLYQEHTSAHFTDIERFRSVEFDRDWNVRGLQLEGAQNLAGASLVVEKDKVLDFEAGGSYFSVGEAFSGTRANGDLRYQEKDRSVVWTGSFLDSDGPSSTRFIRQKTDARWPVGPVLIGFRDDFEWNRFLLEDTLSAASYRFHEWQTWLGSRDSEKLTWRAFYGQRNDNAPRANALQLATFAEEYGLEGGYTPSAQGRFKWNIRRRTLEVRDSALSNSQAEETLLGRLEAAGNLWKGLLSGQLFYETGSGLEQARQFIYLEVPPGQGTYIWVDYNGDGVKDLNEFEVAPFQYEANYIRSFVPSDQYVRTYTNQFSANAQFQPARRWANAEGFKGFAARWSNVASIRLDRKTTRDRGLDRLNPIEQSVNDTSLLSLGSTFRNTLSFNRSNPGFGIEYTLQELTNRSLLANGFEQRSDAFNEVRIRKRIAELITAIVVLKEGQRAARSDFLSGRNFEINYVSLEPEFQWQPSSRFRLTLKGRWVNKENAVIEGIGGEKAVITDGGLQLRFSDPGKGLLEASFNLIQIGYEGEQNNTLAFEMLESLNPGTNATWGLTLQRSISRNLQLNLLYNGRQSEDLEAIHVGSVQLRATF